MPIVGALLCILLGGIINGSFALPTKSIQQWKFENVWINYALWAFLLLPWISIFTLAPQIGTIYLHIPRHILWILVIGGVLFGVGQICFAQSLKMIGIGLSFVINIGLGTGLGFFLPLIVMHPEKVLTPFGFTTLSGIVLILAGLVMSFYAGKQRDLHKRQAQASASSASDYSLGVILAFLAGICSSIQNFTFAATTQMQTLALQHGMNPLASAMIIWPVFLSFSFIPYIIYMFYLHSKNKSFEHYQGAPNAYNNFLTLIMAICWWFSLVLYSRASLLIGGLGPVVGWPLFMVLFILVSNFWGWRHREWAHIPQKIAHQALAAIALLVLAVIVLAYSATLT